VATHVPVLLAEALELLAVRPGGFYVDGTLGLGGHAAAVLDRCAPDGSLLAIDRDEDALQLARDRLGRFGTRVAFAHDDWRALPERLGATRPDGVLLDMGVSSLQFDVAERGFSFRHDGPLDMRMDRSQGQTAAEVLRHIPEHQLADLLFTLGEERRSRKVARAIVQARDRTPLETTAALAQVVRRAIGRVPHGIDSATRTFQALRLFVNRELEGLGAAFQKIARCLTPGGRLVVIAFHSLEDREVKQAFRALAGPEFAVLTKKPLVPGAAEVRENPRSRSAKLRALGRIGVAA
jgi:16S rRNA (cytosine1402-N4)-methyltransferase